MADGDAATDSNESAPHKRSLIVIGASAGGVEALLRLVATLPADLPTPVVIAQHLDPNRTSHLGELLANRTSLAVRSVTAETRLQPGVIYVVPADRDIEVTDHSVDVHGGNRRAPQPSVDLLMASAARVFGDELIAVILTGSGADGAAGAQAVKAHGGTVIVQSPETAAFPSMPLAVPPSAIDIVADLDAIGPLLVDLLHGTYVVPATDDDGELRAFLDRIRERSGLDFNAYKRPTIVRRLQRRMAAVGAATLADYRRHVERHPDEMQRLVAGFLIKVTEFFRDPDLFMYLRDVVLPTLIADARERGELRLWSAGCATGEEAYTLAMLVIDLLGEELGELPVRIFATDISAEAVDFARRGIYPAAALANLPPDLIERHFTRLDGAFEVRKPVRALVIFGEHDLAYRAPFPRIDLVVCRNVLIYFTPELQRRALQLFAFSLRQGGYLALGKAETVSPLPEFFAVEQPRLKVFRRVGEPAPIPATSMLDLSSYAGGRAGRRMPPMRRLDLAPLTRSRDPNAGPLSLSAFELLPVGIVVVERNYHIRSINTAGRRLLGIHSDPVGDDLIHQAPPALAGPLRVGLDAAFRGGTTSALHRFPEDVLDDGDRDLSLTFGPADHVNGETTAATAVVIVSDVTNLAEPLRQSDRERAAVAAELERQASRTNDAVAEVRELRAANESLALGNARLRAENEELLVANEEAQAAAEEIETLNEELQATNEELETLNEELQATVEELTATNDELQARTIELQAAVARREQSERGAGGASAS